MRVCCVSDLHGYLPEIPDCDLLCLGGDIVPTTMHDVPNARGWLNTNFRSWLDDLASRMNIVGIAGNHDFVFERDAVHFITPLSWTYLQDDFVVEQGVHIYGSPHTPYFHNWAFNLFEDDLAKRWEDIPTSTDILIVHGPPHGCGDMVKGTYPHRVGSPSLRRRIETIKPRLVVCGHIHSGYGVYKIEDTTVVNCAYVDEDYRPCNKPVLIDFDLQQVLEVVDCGPL